jgi:apolipoprotein N-acyltransferase
MQPASQDPFEIYGVYILVLGIAFLIIGIFYIFSRESSRREHMKKWLIIVIKLVFSAPFYIPSGTPRRKSAREETDHEALQAEVDPGAGAKDRRN